MILTGAVRGEVVTDSRSKCKKKLMKTSNHELSVFIRGEDIQSMLAEGAWDEVIPCAHF